MVLLSKLFFFASIPCSILGLGYSSPKSDYHQVLESIDGKLKGYSNDKDKAEVLRADLISASLGYKILLNEMKKDTIKFDQMEKSHHIKEIMFNACLARQALVNLEMIVFPLAVYNDQSTSYYDKWMLALLMYRSPILDGIRDKLDKANLQPRQFALAVADLHALISSRFAHPDLKQYGLPRDKESVRQFCSFIDELHFDTLLPEENKPHREAAYVVCESALMYPKVIIDPNQEEKIIAGQDTEFSAVIVIKNASDLDKSKADIFLNKVPLERYDSQDPYVDKNQNAYNLVYHFVCKYIPPNVSTTPHPPNKEQDNYGLRIKDALATHFKDAKKTITLYRSRVADVMDT